MIAARSAACTNVGTMQASSVETGETLWVYEQRAGMISLLSTAGGLVFGGDTNGRFRAFDQRAGRVLWEVNPGSPISGYPVTFARNMPVNVAPSASLAPARSVVAGASA